LDEKADTRVVLLGRQRKSFNHFAEGNAKAPDLANGV
jgi:hypothetical protein